MPERFVCTLVQRSLSPGKGLMLAETVSDTDGQTLGILKYKTPKNTSKLRNVVNLRYW